MPVTQVIEFVAEQGRTLTVRLFADADDTIVATASVVVAGTNFPDRYSATFTDVPAGDYALRAFDTVGGATAIVDIVQGLLLVNGTYQASALKSVVATNLSQILGVTLTESAAGRLAAAFKKLFDVATPLLATDAAGLKKIFQNQMDESYKAAGNAPTPEQALFEVLQNITNAKIVGLVKTARKLNGTDAKTYQLDAASPTDISELT